MAVFKIGCNLVAVFKRGQPTTPSHTPKCSAHEQIYVVMLSKRNRFPSTPGRLKLNPLRRILLIPRFPGNYSKWSSSSSTPRPSTVTDASRPRRRRTSSSAPSPPSSPRFKRQKLWRTPPRSVNQSAGAHTGSHRIEGTVSACWFHRAAGCFVLFFAVRLACVKLGWAFFFCHCGCGGLGKGGRLFLLLMDSLERVFLPGRQFCLSCVRRN